MGVHDAFACFSALAKHHLEQFSLTKIAISGSNGKTTTKEMVKALLVGACGEAQVFASSGGLNNHFGVPLTALAVTSKHSYAVFEMGMNHTGELAGHCDIVKPGLALLTNISMAHEGNFADGIEGVANAKGELFAAIGKHGHGVINSDDERVLAQAKKHGLTTFTTYGTKPGADVLMKGASPFDVTTHTQTVHVQIGGQEFDCLVPLPGIHHGKNAVAALAVMHALGFDAQTLAKHLLTMFKTRGRMSLFATATGVTVIDDGYNANPTSMRAGISAAQEFQPLDVLGFWDSWVNLAKKALSNILSSVDLLQANSIISLWWARLPCLSLKVLLLRACPARRYFLTRHQQKRWNPSVGLLPKAIWYLLKARCRLPCIPSPWHLKPYKELPCY